MDIKKDKLKFYIMLASLAVYAISLTQTAFTGNDSVEGQYKQSALSVFLMGGTAFLGGGLLEWFIWFANPIYTLAFILFYRSDKFSKIASVAATTIALSFATWKKILVSESGRLATIEHLNAGYWLWLLSLLILSVGIMYYFKDSNNTPDHANISSV